MESGVSIPSDLYHSVPIDHLSPSNATYLQTYNMRYLVNSTYFDNTTGPILFYAGNEGDIWTFYNNSGFVTKTLAQ
jgi:hypothetical protein